MKKLTIILILSLVAFVASAQQVVKAGNQSKVVSKPDSAYIMANTRNESVRKVIVSKTSVSNCETADYILALIGRFHKNQSVRYAKK